MCYQHLGEIYMTNNLSSDLYDWSDIKDKFDKSDILLGNGFSQNISKRFNYKSLFHLVSKKGQFATRPLRPQDISLFQALDTENFETVLNSIAICKRILKTLNQYSNLLNTCEKNIRESLIHAVNNMHLRQCSIPLHVINAISTELNKYSSVFTTNYDLLLYWSMMNSRDTLCDYFWGKKIGNMCAFDPNDIHVGYKKIPIHYLHGGLHLCKSPNGSTCKLVWDEDSILEQFTQLSRNNLVPLFVSEGNAEQKLSSIKSSVYLKFALSRLEKTNIPLVILGHGLSQSDSHIVDIISKKTQKIAISVHNNNQIIRRKIAILNALHKDLDNKADLEQIHFFDSKSHPLGAKELQCD